MTQISTALTTAASSVAIAASWLSRKAVSEYRKVDPDVPRHLLQLPILSYSLLLPRTAPIAAAHDDGEPPLVFVHGLAANRGTFLPMAAYLWLHGRRRTYRIDFAATPSIDAMAEALAAFVREVLRVNAACKADIVAHSMGGLVARLAILEHGLARKTRMLVTLGAPHAGTHLARFANTEMMRELRPHSSLIQRLNARAWPKSVLCVSMWSKSDVFVLPPESARLAAGEQVDLTPMTHYGYLIHPKAWEAVRQALQNRPPARRRR